jgi:hypothetical protein
MDPATGLPYGWNERTNAVRDPGRVATASFSARGAYGASDEGDASYKTSEEVEAYWMSKIDAERRAQAPAPPGKKSHDEAKSTQKRLPIDWDERAKRRAADAERYGASANASGGSDATASASAATSPELALVRVATNACESLAAVLDQRLVSLPEEDRAAFAAAVSRSLALVVKCR